MILVLNMDVAVRRRVGWRIQRRAFGGSWSSQDLMDTSPPSSLKSSGLTQASLLLTPLLCFRCQQPDRRPSTRNLGGNANRLRSRQFMFEGRRLCLLEAVDEPTAGRPRRAVGLVDGHHVDDVAPRRRMIGCDFNERAACEFRLDGMQGHGSETQARAQESQLGAEVREPPNFWILREGRHERARQIVRINMRDLDVFGEDSGRYPP